MMEKIHPTAKIQTWGTTAGESGILNFLKKSIKGENVGHASIELQLPATPENKLLIEKYCHPPAKIPFVEKPIGKNDDGTLQTVYIVRFSFLPGRSDTSKFSLAKTYAEDCMIEHSGANTTSRQYLEMHELSERRAGSKTIKLYPLNTLTEKGRAMDFASPEGKAVLYLKEYKDLDDAGNAINILKQKIKQVEKYPLRMSKDHKTLALILKTLGIQHKETLTQEDTEKILADVDIKNRARTERSDELNRLMVALEPNLENGFINKMTDYLARGRPADGEVELPLGEAHGLNAEAMLAQMHDIAVSDHEYNLYTFNCSDAAALILNAGLDGHVSRVAPGMLPSLNTPQTIFDTALMHRNEKTYQSIHESIHNLNKFYETHDDKSIVTVQRDSSSLREAILNFAVETLFPTQGDQLTNQFYVFSAEDRVNFFQNTSFDELELVPTELLRDLWGIIPQRSLPLSLDQDYKVLIDQNLNFKDLIQGLTTLAQINATNRLSQHLGVTSENEDAFELNEVVEIASSSVPMDQGLAVTASLLEERRDLQVSIKSGLDKLKDRETLIENPQMSGHDITPGMS